MSAIGGGYSTLSPLGRSRFMPRIFSAVADLVRRWVSEGPRTHGDERAHDDPHVGYKSSDEPGFGRPTGAEERAERKRRRPPKSGPSADDER
ncbi:hypothetical protein GCM10027447_11310 [Glycomyces halotolerans]